VSIAAKRAPSSRGDRFVQIKLEEAEVASEIGAALVRACRLARTEALPVMSKSPQAGCWSLEANRSSPRGKI
jgi:hypothetical protein